MKLRRRQYTLITLTVITVMGLVLGCGLPLLSTSMVSNALEPQTHSLTHEDLPLVENSGAWLGIIGASMQPGMAQAMNLPEQQTGVLIHFVEANSPAQQVDIQGSQRYVTQRKHRWLVGGDIIIAFNGQTINTMLDLQHQLRQTQSGQTISLTLLRDGISQTLTPTLAPLPELDLTIPNSSLQVT